MMEENKYLGKSSEPVIPATSDEKSIALLSHVLTVVSAILAPLIIYLVKKDESAFVAAHAKESLNFQLTIIIICILLVITVIGIMLIWLVMLASLALVIVATLRASEGKMYKYPINFRLIK